MNEDHTFFSSDHVWWVQLCAATLCSNGCTAGQDGNHIIKIIIFTSNYRRTNTVFTTFMGQTPQKSCLLYDLLISLTFTNLKR